MLETIRAEGLEIYEKLVLEHSSPKARDWHDATRVTVRNDLRNDLDECLKKLVFHTNELRAYVAWREVLSANPDARLSLDHEDWQFFFLEARNGSALSVRQWRSYPGMAGTGGHGTAPPRCAGCWNICSLALTGDGEVLRSGSGEQVKRRYPQP